MASCDSSEDSLTDPLARRVASTKKLVAWTGRRRHEVATWHSLISLFELNPFQGVRRLLATCVFCISVLLTTLYFTEEQI